MRGPGRARIGPAWSPAGSQVALYHHFSSAPGGSQAAQQAGHRRPEAHTSKGEPPTQAPRGALPARLSPRSLRSLQPLSPFLSRKAAAQLTGPGLPPQSGASASYNHPVLGMYDAKDDFPPQKKTGGCGATVGVRGLGGPPGGPQGRVSCSVTSQKDV